MEDKIILRVESGVDGNLYLVDQYNRRLDNVITMNINIEGPNEPIITLELIDVPINLQYVPSLSKHRRVDPRDPIVTHVMEAGFMHNPKITAE